MAKCVTIDEDECVGCESCVELCPDVFVFDEGSGKARVIKPEGLEECIQEAMDSCPVECIHWEEE